MKERNDNIIYNKSLDFAIKIVELFKALYAQKEYIMSKQLLRSGTSIGANVSEAIEAQSKRDFIAKLSISLKEATETEYWLELLYRTNYIHADEYTLLKNGLDEIRKILNAIIKTSKATIKATS